jgi:hypothetical protein
VTVAASGTESQGEIKMARGAKGLVWVVLAAGCAQVAGGSSAVDPSTPKPELQALQPAVGPTTGGETITIRGANFPKDALVRWNGVLGENIKVVSATEITATLPASTAVGKVKVTVSSAAGQEASREDLFSYYYGQIAFDDMTVLTTGAGPKGVILADVDGDKRIDLVTANALESSLSLFLGQQGGQFGPVQRVDLPSSPDALSASDIDGDGKPDLLIAAGSQSRVFTLRNTGLGGAGLFSLVGTTQVGQGPFAIASADLNADGRVDAVVANRGGSLSVLMNKGGAMWDAPQTVTVTGLPAGLAIGDTNKDGRPDVAVSSYQDNTVQIFANNGSGMLAASGPAQMVGVGPTGVTLFDFNSDGFLDLTAVCENTGGVSVLLGQAAGAFASGQSYPTAAYPSMALADDLNGDGRTDLLVLNGGTRGSLIILPGQGDGTFVSGNSSQRISLSISPSAFAAADIDGDGKQDLVVVSQSGGKAVVLRNQSR